MHMSDLNRQKRVVLLVLPLFHQWLLYILPLLLFLGEIRGYLQSMTQQLVNKLCLAANKLIVSLETRNPNKLKVTSKAV